MPDAHVREQMGNATGGFRRFLGWGTKRKASFRENATVMEHSVRLVNAAMRVLATDKSMASECGNAEPRDCEDRRLIEGLPRP
jgi:hypothetical protein